MSVKDDIIKLVQNEEDFFRMYSRYIQALSTPEEIPVKSSITNITELRQPSDEPVKIPFIPTVKDYQFRVDVWSRLEDEKETYGFIVTAKRDLGDDITETITTKKRGM